MGQSVNTRRNTALPRVSVVIVCWNRLFDVLLNLQQLSKVDYPDLELIVVDNGSSAATVNELKKVSDIRLICLDENRGPCAARNVGVEASTGKYILFLDSDAALDPKCLRSVVRQMEADESIGIAGFKVLDWRARTIDQWIYAQPCATHADQTFDTYSFSAAGALVRADALQKAGGFWEELFIYNEEVELSLRLIRAGYRVIYTPKGRVYHRPSGNGRASQASYFRNQIRNWIWIFQRHYPRPLSWWKVAVYIFVYLIKGLTNRNLLACLKGIGEGLFRRPDDVDITRKLTWNEARQVATLNRRTRVRLWNLATVETQIDNDSEETNAVLAEM